MNAWLTAKKRGRDDALIEVDRKKAIENRRKAKFVSRKQPTTCKIRKTAANKKKSKDDYDDDSFIADDDDDMDEGDYSEHDEIENYDDSEEVDEDIIDDEDSDTEPKHSKRPPSRTNGIADKNVVDDSNSSDEDNPGSTFFASYKPRTSIPPPAMRKKSDFFPKNRQNQKTAKTIAAPIKNPFNKINVDKASTGSRIRPFKSVLSNDSTDEYDDESVLFATEHNDSKEDDTTNEIVTQKTPKGKVNDKVLPAPDNDLEDTPEPTQKLALNGAKKSRLTKLKKPLVSCYSDDDTDESIKLIKNQTNRFATYAAPNKKLTKENPNNHSVSRISGADYCEDENEATALAWALSESAALASSGGSLSHDDGKSRVKIMPKNTAGTAKNIKNPSKVIYKDDIEDEVVQLHSDDEGDNDSYIDDDAEAASSILQTANALSKQVLQNMIHWTVQHCSEATESTRTNADGKNSNSVKIPMGMIVDGAVALSSVSAVNFNQNSSTSSNTDALDIDHKQSTWISKELMQQILPNVKLAEYQLIGVNWMALLHNMKCEIVDGSSSKKKKKRNEVSKAVKTTNVNGILADEMGLGKTVQTIAFLSWLHFMKTKGKIKENGIDTNPSAIVSIDEDSVKGNNDRHPKGNDRDDDSGMLPHLIVAPASVISNWENEFHKFAPQLNVVKYHGTLQERQDMQKDMMLRIPNSKAVDGKKKARPSIDNNIDIVLASVTYFQKEQSDDRSFLRRFRYEYVVVDEAHLLKNARGIRYKSLDKMISNHRLLLTGTPVQNSPKELMSLLCFLMPLFSRRGSGGEENDYDGNGGNDGGEGMLQHFISLEGKGSDAGGDQEAYRKLKQLFSPFVLRRRKQDVLNQILPPKERRVELVHLDDNARKQYDSIIEEHVEAKKSGMKLNFEHLFTQLRKAAHHPLLVRSRYRSPSEKEHLVHWFHQYGAFRGEANTKKRVAEELEKYSDFEIHLTAHDLVSENVHRREEIGRYLLSEDDLYSSAKFNLLRTLLPDLIHTKGHRVLIFSGWTTMLDLLTCLMDSLGLKYMRMDGQTDVSERQTLIDTYNNDPSIPVFLLSTRASGLGITLTSAQVCIIHDLDFNPFNDLQAEDRCHRIGQKEKVTVIKLVTADTVDQDVYAMQERKSRMNSAIMDNHSSPKNSSDNGTNNRSDEENQQWNAKEAKIQKDRIIETTMNRFIQEKNKQRLQQQSKNDDKICHELDPSENVRPQLFQASDGTSSVPAKNKPPTIEID